MTCLQHSVYKADFFRNHHYQIYGVLPNNVIYRLMALVPFPEQLALTGDDAEDSFPLIRAVGRLFDVLQADRSVMGAAATRIIGWTEGKIQEFAKARLEILGFNYFQEPTGAAGPVCEDTDSEDGSLVSEEGPGEAEGPLAP